MIRWNNKNVNEQKNKKIRFLIIKDSKKKLTTTKISISTFKLKFLILNKVILGKLAAPTFLCSIFFSPDFINVCENIFNVTFRLTNRIVCLFLSN